MMLDAAIYHVASDIRPLSSLQGVGMKQIIQTAIKIGARCGEVDAAEIIPSRRQIGRELTKSAILKRKHNQQKLEEIVQLRGAGVAFDFWTCELTKVCCLLFCRIFSGFISYACCALHRQKLDIAYNIIGHTNV
jgi:hypothetical protein